MKTAEGEPAPQAKGEKLVRLGRWRHSSQKGSDEVKKAGCAYCGGLASGPARESA